MPPAGKVQSSKQTNCMTARASILSKPSTGLDVMAAGRSFVSSLNFNLVKGCLSRNIVNGKTRFSCERPIKQSRFMRIINLQAFPTSTLAVSLFSPSQQRVMSGPSIILIRLLSYVLLHLYLEKFYF